MKVVIFHMLTGRESGDHEFSFEKEMADVPRVGDTVILPLDNNGQNEGAAITVGRCAWFLAEETVEIYEPSSGPRRYSQESFIQEWIRDACAVGWKYKKK